MQNCIARAFMVWTSCACAAVIPCLFGRKLAPHFGLQINTVSLRLEHIIFTTELKKLPRSLLRAVVVLSRQAWQTFTYCSAKCNSLLLFVRTSFSGISSIDGGRLFGRIISREESEGEKSLRPAHI